MTSVLAGTRTIVLSQEIGMDRHMHFLEQYLDEPERLHKLHTNKLEEIDLYERGEWQVAKDSLDAEKGRLFLIINETPSDNGKGAAAAEVLRVANAELAQAKEVLETQRARLTLQVFEAKDGDKPKYANDKLREAALLVAQDGDQAYREAAVAYRAAEERAAKAKADADVQVPKPKYSNEAARNAALVQLQQTDHDYMAALSRFRRADTYLTNLKAQAEDLKQQIANVSGKLWGLRKLVEGDTAVLMAVSTLDGPKLPAEIRLTAPESMPPINLVSKGVAA